jgi:hypothetical protein
MLVHQSIRKHATTLGINLLVDELGLVGVTNDSPECHNHVRTLVCKPMLLSAHLTMLVSLRFSLLGQSSQTLSFFSRTSADGSGK